MKRTLAKLWKLCNLPKNLQLFLVRFANDSFLVGITAVVINDKHEILLVKHTYRQTPWSLPGGYMKKGEHPRTGAAREIEEETGLKVKIEKIIRTRHDPDTARLDISCFGKFVGGKFRPSAEVTEFEFFPWDALPTIGENQTKLIVQVLRSETDHFSSTISTLFHRLFRPKR